MNKILIIGGCGYIGSRIFQFLKRKKFHADTVDTEWFGNYVNPKNIKVNYRELKKSFLNSYQVIILLAGYSSVRMCQRDMLGAFKNNVENFVELLNKLEKQKFIYASSSSIYGNTQKLQVNETYNRYSPSNYYDLTKKEIDYYAELSRVRFYGLRFGTVNGLSPNLRTDLMINKMYGSANTAHKITIYNPDVYRPILGIEDLCRAVYSIIKQDGSVGLYNLTSFNSTIREISQKVADAIGDIKIINKGTTLSYNFSISTKKFEEEFGFKFRDTVENIVNSLMKGYNKSHHSVRNKLDGKSKKM